MASEEELLNQSVEGVEFELLKGLKKLTETTFKSIAVVSNQGEPMKEHLIEFTNALNEFYNVERVPIKNDTSLNRFELVIVAAPTKYFTDSQKVALDQYVMQGGKLMVVMDAADIRKDSLQSGQTFGLQRELNLNDLLFKYGVRMNQNAIQDLNCTKTIVQTGLQGEVQALDFPYYPIIYKFNTHPIVKNLDAIVLRLAGSIDTVKADGVKKTILLQTSEQSKAQQVPFQIDLDMLRKNSAPETFNQRNLIAGVLLEGTFQSLYKNRNISFVAPLLDKSKPTKIIVFSDADLVKNEYNAKLHKAIPLGYDKDLNYQFSNKDLLMNAVDYLLQESFISVRTTEVKLRPLNKNKVRDEKEFWKYLNILSPIVALIGFGVLRYRWRKNKYGKK
jgi:gliding-associated putative ABC transporter substrate-binding component GldG